MDFLTMSKKPLFCAGLLLFSVAALLGADWSRAGRGQPQSSDGFELLFNGLDLRGWKGDTNRWSVQHSNLVGQTAIGAPLRENTFLIWTNGTVHDFELQLDCKITADNAKGVALSGIQYRSRELTNSPTRFVVRGYQAGIDASGLVTGALYEERGRGVLAERGQMTRIGSTGTVHLVAALGTASELQSVIKSEDWNNYAIIARGNQLTHIINGRVMVHVTDTQEGVRAFNGIIALELHAGESVTVEFRNIRMKSL
jgi:hypothetical protein